MHLRLENLFLLVLSKFYLKGTFKIFTYLVIFKLTIIVILQPIYNFIKIKVFF